LQINNMATGTKNCTCGGEINTYVSFGRRRQNRSFVLEKSHSNEFAGTLAFQM